MTSVKYISDIETWSISSFPFVGDITIGEYITEKIDVFVGITRLLKNITEGDSNIAYETNETNIKQVITYH